MDVSQKVRKSLCFYIGTNNVCVAVTKTHALHWSINIQLNTIFKKQPIFNKKKR